MTEALANLTPAIANQPTADRLAEFYKNLRVTPHPILALPSAEQVTATLMRQGGKEELVEGLRKREQLIKLMSKDPFAHSWEPQMWHDADKLLATHKDICALGGNRATKSNWAAKRVCQLLFNNPRKTVWCFSTSAHTSKRDQQSLIWTYLPLEWKQLEGTMSKTTYIAYKKKTGFSENSFIAPNGSECHFFNYEQDVDVLEGGQIDLWWADELLPIDWLLNVRGRTIDRKGKGILTFTPKRGFTPTVSDYVTGAKVLKWTDCELLPNQQCWPGGKAGQIPYIMQSLDPDRAVIFFQSKWNPFIDYKGELVKLWKPRGKTQILIRLHGVTEKSSGSAIPTFGSHNIIPHHLIPVEGTNYHLLDFAWNRNWFMLWLRVQELLKGKRRIYCYREWPDRNTYGEWAVMSDEPDGARGPAQDSRGYSIDQYKKLILQAEGRSLSASSSLSSSTPTEANWSFHRPANPANPQILTPERIHIRYGDARSGNAATITATRGGTSIREMLAEPNNGLPSIDVSNVAATDGKHLIEEGVNLLLKWFEYDDEKPITIDNEPSFYISDQCENIRDCLKIWSGAGGEKGASKDPLDLLRYAAVMDIRDVPEGWYGSRGGGSY
jgi:hypothetical protein